ncbi:MAG TPA: sulfatase-like hydrolase/transferase [Spirochaetota bacterium]|nr:sulfatase-like hydrolase/transferase [Spirochaetota bacterium]HPC42421.1 sulfatase-like hydrolase/transferase [Spirochaetota bacterium]HPL16685.1 sulfatase-like hydrolase/transferase [Spirochaetota bacterium]HQF06592.1 sulfatase-like hydrolase/transferase [Spirochaetota bacterium]HQH96005.1 sulfatase-like hydrolase/transferase [Spirochaetota bacterium]
MNRIWTRIETRYNSIFHLFLADGLVAMMLFVFYRLRIYRYIQALYPDIKLKGFADFLYLSLHHDSAALCVTMACMFLMLFITAGHRKTRYCIMTGYSVILVFFLLFSMEFFRVYETSFQKNYAGREHFSALGNIIDSALAEFSVEFYILFFFFSALAVAMNIALYRWEKNTDLQEVVEFHSDLLIFRVLRLLMPAACVLSLGIALATDASAAVRSHEMRYRNDTARYLSLLREFSMNPVCNLVRAAPGGPGGTEAPGAKGGAPFAFRLNTDSLETGDRYSRQDLMPRRKRYNIILYFFESTPRRYYDIRINGRYVIDTWHRLERNSLNFRNHYVNYPLSANALLTVFTSAYDLNSKDMVIQKYPDIGLRTISEILKDRRYRTCLIHTGGLGYAGQKRFLKNRKFDEILEYNELIKIPPYNRQVGWGIDERAMIKPAVDYLKRDPETPCLLVLLPVNPHHPYAIPGEEFKITGAGAGEEDYRKRNWSNYLNSLHYADASLGMLVDELERNNLMEDTLLFLFADHGEAFYQHRMNYNHPFFLYEENVHVPFLIYNRKLFPSPEYYDSITRHIDILPTILDILGIPPSPEQEGVSVFTPRREQMALLHTSWKDDFMGVADRQWKYILRTEDRMEELYNIREDPEERNNIAARHPDVAERYRRFVLRARTYKDAYYERILGGKKESKAP